MSSIRPLVSKMRVSCVDRLGSPPSQPLAGLVLGRPSKAESESRVACRPFYGLVSDSLNIIVGPSGPGPCLGSPNWPCIGSRVSIRPVDEPVSVRLIV